MNKFGLALVLVLAMAACSKQNDLVRSPGSRPKGDGGAVVPAVIPPAVAVDASKPLHGVFQTDCEKESISDQGFNLNGRRTFVTITSGNLSQKLVRYVDADCDTTRFSGTVEYKADNWDFTVTKAGAVDSDSFTIKYTAFNSSPLGDRSTSEDVSISSESEPFGVETLRFSLDASSAYRRK